MWRDDRQYGPTRSSRGGSRAPIVVDSDHDFRGTKMSLLAAIAFIQQYYEMERKSGQEVSDELVTIKVYLDFMAAGVRSALAEGLWLILLMPLVEFLLLPKIVDIDWTTEFLFRSIPFFGLIGYALVCCFIARYYVGNATKKLIQHLLMGRALVLVGKGVVIWLVYTLLAQWATPENVWAATDSSWFNDAWRRTVYYWMLRDVQPALEPAANSAMKILIIGALVPYAAIVVSKRWKDWRVSRRMQKVLTTNTAGR